MLFISSGQNPLGEKTTRRLYGDFASPKQSLIHTSYKHYIEIKKKKKKKKKLAKSLGSTIKSLVSDHSYTYLTHLKEI